MSRRSVWLTVSVSVVCLFLLAGVGPLPFDPRTPHLGAALSPPNGAHWFGTDRTGLDVFSVTLAATAQVLPLALVGVLIGGLIGSLVGVAAASSLSSASSVVTAGLMRVLDMLQALPVVVLMVIVVGLSGRGTNAPGVITALALVNVPLFAKVTYAQALGIVNLPFVSAARAYGASRLRVAVRHLLPGVGGVVAGQFSLSVGHGIIALAALGFLGLGVAPPDPSWGELIRQGSEDIASGVWWLLVFPTAAICLLVLALNGIARRLTEWSVVRHG